MERLICINERMLNILKFRMLLLLWVALLTFAVSVGGEDKSFDLTELEGDWEGTGEFMVPMSKIKMDIAGSAKFVYDTDAGHLRTAITGTKFIFSYSDSGYLAVDPVTDSVSWEVWDNFGKHAKYFGRMDNGVIRGERMRGKDIYAVAIDLIATDTIDFKLTQTKPDGSVLERATFHLWRVE